VKRRELIRHLEASGCQLLREGGSHSIYTNPAKGVREAIPRHQEIKKHLARSICRRLGVEITKGA
jgi:predicted RNA binding protein YcfA (HicA-like mRNA interferase family)